LNEEDSDTWTVKHVAQYLVENGFKEHINLFSTSRVDGKRLLSFKSAYALAVSKAIS
jgi:hypothetical protein